MCSFVTLRVAFCRDAVKERPKKAISSAQKKIFGFDEKLSFSQTKVQVKQPPFFPKPNLAKRNLYNAWGLGWFIHRGVSFYV